MKTNRSKFPVLRIGVVATICVAAGLLCSGCFVASIYPFYHETDLKFDPALVGSWVPDDKTDDGKEVWTFEKEGERSYKLTLVDGDGKHEFDARLFTLKGTNFLDCLDRDRREYSQPVHLLVRVKQINPKLELRSLNVEWLGKLLEKNPGAIRHTTIPKKIGDGDDGGDLILTADTAALQKFIIKHLNTADAWTGDGSLKRK